MQQKILNWFGKDAKTRYFNITNIVFICVIFLASFASLFHVRGFWLITNTTFWASALAVSTGLSIIGSMLATRYTWLAYLSFFVIILMELIGNVFDAFMKVNVNDARFIGFKNLTEPLFNLIYSSEEVIADVVYMRWIASIEGMFIPILVVIMMHIWMKIRESFKISQETEITEKIQTEKDIENSKVVELLLKEVVEVQEKLSLTEQQLEKSNNEWLQKNTITTIGEPIIEVVLENPVVKNTEEILETSELIQVEQLPIIDEPVIEPHIEPILEPIVEPIIEPIVELIIEPIVESIIEELDEKKKS